MPPTDSTQQGAQSGTQLPVPPAIPGGQEIYDLIMENIEPDLTTAALPTLKEKYAGETSDAAKARADRYQAAFAAYDRRYALYLADQENQVRTYQRQLGSGVERYARSEENQDIDQIESAISNA